MAVHIHVRKYLSYLHCVQYIRSLQHYSTIADKHGIETVSASKRVETVGESLAAKGFLRSHKPYQPPANVTEKVHTICATLNVPTKASHQLNNVEEKFKFLTTCFENFNHSVPNSQLYEMETVGDIIEFYKKPVNTTVPFDALRQIKLPPNLHIQYDYVRFNPETDTKFNGQTAFPKSSTLVTGLKYREKYAGHEAKRSWP